MDNGEVRERAGRFAVEGGIHLVIWALLAASAVGEKMTAAALHHIASGKVGRALELYPWVVLFPHSC